MRKAIFIALAAASVSLMASPTSAVFKGDAYVAIFRPITMTPTGFTQGNVVFGGFVTDGQAMTATLTPSGALSNSPNAVPLDSQFKGVASFKVNSDAALFYKVTVSTATTGNVVFQPKVASSQTWRPFTQEGPTSSDVNVGGTLSVVKGVYGLQKADYTVTVNYVY